MLIFSVVVLGLIMLVMAMLLPALQRSQTQLKSDKNAERRAIYRGQFEELAQDKASGALSEAQYEVAKTELERRMLNEIGADMGARAIVTAPDRRLTYVLALLIPLTALGIYHKIGKPAAILDPAIFSVTEASNATQAQVDTLLAQIKASLANNPNDAEGWRLLARAHASLANFNEALPAFEKASELAPNDVDLLADYADALAIANGFKLAGKPEALLERALKINPKHEKSLKLAGAAAFERQDFAKVTLLWGRLKEQLPKDSPILPELTAAIEKAQAMANEKPSTP